MTTPAQNTLLHAADLLEADAKSWLERNEYERIRREDTLLTAIKLRQQERVIKVDHIPDAGKMVYTVSPAPTFEGERNG